MLTVLLAVLLTWSSITPAAGQWLLVEDRGVLAATETDVRTLLANVAEAPELAVFALDGIDDGSFAYLATVLSDASIDRLEALRGAIERQAASSLDSADGLSAWQLERQPDLDCVPVVASTPTTSPSFFRYELFEVEAEQVAEVTRLLRQRANQCRARSVPTGDAVLHSINRDGAAAKVVFALASAGADRASCDRDQQRLATALGGAGRKLTRKLASRWQALTLIEGTVNRRLTVRASLAGLPPGAPPQRMARPLEPLPDRLPEPPSTQVATQPPVVPAMPLPPPSPAPAARAEPSTPPAPMAAKPVARKSDPAELIAVARRWAAAWSAQDVEGYVGAYARTFVPPGGLSRSAWERERRQRITAPTSISVELDGLVAGFDGPRRGWVTFAQRYRSDRFSDQVIKRLELVLEDGGWRIARESLVE